MQARSTKRARKVHPLYTRPSSTSVTLILGSSDKSSASPDKGRYSFCFSSC
jgi:hypothetical protein